MKLRFYRCAVCGKIIAVVSATGVPTICCGQPMKEMIPNVTDGAVEKHVPVFSAVDRALFVQVGDFPHPMTDDHYIAWIGVRTSNGFRFRELHPGDRPEAAFYIEPDDGVEAVYSFCNLHGLWSSDDGSSM